MCLFISDASWLSVRVSSSLGGNADVVMLIMTSVWSTYFAVDRRNGEVRYAACIGKSGKTRECDKEKMQKLSVRVSSHLWKNAEKARGVMWIMISV